jgi:hypothetical protein
LLRSNRNQRGGSRPGAGRKPKTLLEHVEAGSYRATRHRWLLLTDDTVLEAAEGHVELDWLGQAALWQAEYRHACRKGDLRRLTLAETKFSTAARSA